jgi:simple sugar transport system permease protein
VPVTLNLLASSIATATLASTAVLIAATGELLAERVGVFNIGIEGSMLAGALAGLVATNSTGHVGIGLLAAAAVGMGASFVFGLTIAVFRANMVVAGLAITFLGIGLTGVLGQDYVRQAAEQRIPRWNIPFLSEIPYLGEALFRQFSLTYVAFLMPFAVWFLLYRTRHGLNLRAVGESPVAADVAGIAVTVWRLVYVTIGGAFAGVAGAFLSLGQVGTWIPGMTSGQGFVAIAIVIFASWEPLFLILGAFLFGALGTLGNVAQALGWGVPSEFFSALPYAGTLALLYAVTWTRTQRAGQPPWPAGLGVPFFRGAD